MTHMPFGKHKGKVLREVPEDYLAWLLTITLREPLASAVREELAGRTGRKEESKQDERRRAAQEEARRRAGAGASSPSARALRDPEIASMARQIVDRGFRQLALAHHPDRRGGDTAAMQVVNAAVTALRGFLGQNAA